MPRICWRGTTLSRLPAPLRPFALLAFRTLVAGRSLDLDDARELMKPLGLEDSDVRRIPDAPALLMTGRRRASS